MNAMSALNRFALAKAPKELLQNAVVGLTLQGYEALCQAPTEQSATKLTYVRIKNSLHKALPPKKPKIVFKTLRVFTT